MSFPKNNITARCFVNAPWQMLKTDLLELFLEHGIQPEIGLEGTCLYDEDPAEFRRVADILRKHNLACTLHAPFFDLAPGAFDPYILAASREKLRRAFDLLAIFRPRSIVCHLQFETNKQGYKLQEWTASALATWHSCTFQAIRRSLLCWKTPTKSPRTLTRQSSRNSTRLTPGSAWMWAISWPLPILPGRSGCRPCHPGWASFISMTIMAKATSIWRRGEVNSIFPNCSHF